eukprot:SAG22_NODE_388_length_11295_cov_14.512594_13_plen_199_part_00
MPPSSSLTAPSRILREEDRRSCRSAAEMLPAPAPPPASSNPTPVTSLSQYCPSDWIHWTSCGLPWQNVRHSAREMSPSPDESASTLISSANRVRVRARIGPVALQRQKGGKERHGPKFRYHSSSGSAAERQCLPTHLAQVGPEGVGRAGFGGNGRGIPAGVAVPGGSPDGAAALVLGVALLERPLCVQVCTRRRPGEL